MKRRNRLTYVPTLALMWVVLAVTGCEHDLAQSPKTPTLGSIQTTIFTPKCGVSGCHVPGGAGPMPLRNKDESFSNLVGVASVQKRNLNRVEPGQPDNSYLVLKIEGASGIAGGRMPPGGSSLSGAQMQAIRDWITAGANND